MTQLPNLSASERGLLKLAEAARPAEWSADLGPAIDLAGKFCTAIPALIAEVDRLRGLLTEYAPLVDRMRAVVENRDKKYPTDKDCIRETVSAALDMMEVEVRARAALAPRLDGERK